MTKVDIPMQSAKKEKLIAIPQREYAAFLQWQKKMRAEIKDADKAIAVAKNEKLNGKLKLAASFSTILKPAR